MLVCEQRAANRTGMDSDKGGIAANRVGGGGEWWSGRGVALGMKHKSCTWGKAAR